MSDHTPPPPVGPLSVLASVLRSWFGVQSEANRQRDFASQDPAPFIVAGLLFTVGLVVAVIVVVKLALASAGQ